MVFGTAGAPWVAVKLLHFMVAVGQLPSANRRGMNWMTVSLPVVDLR